MHKRYIYVYPENTGFGSSKKKLVMISKKVKVGKLGC